MTMIMMMMMLMMRMMVMVMTIRMMIAYDGRGASLEHIAASAYRAEHNMEFSDIAIITIIIIIIIIFISG
eukprot:4010015-Karenia_brevis.AAC.1